MNWSSLKTVDANRPRRPARATAILALGLMLFSVGMRVAHAHPIPTLERAGVSAVETSEAHSKNCGLCISATLLLVLDPRTPTLAPPNHLVAPLVPSVSSLATRLPDSGRAIRAPPVA